ncbi:MAG: YbaN family protein, partial [Geminicoccaceae bacterium]
MRLLWVAGGIVSFGLGVVGAVLPLLPTTPFMLLAAFCFARSSPRLHDWLLRHRHFGPMIENWRRHGAIDRRSKFVATALCAVALLTSFLIGLSATVITVQALVLFAVMAFLWSRPDA